jgi:hypothetical protein
VPIGPGGLDFDFEKKPFLVLAIRTCERARRPDRISIEPVPEAFRAR